LTATELLPWRPSPKPNELFSSWLRRLAVGNSGKIQTFCHLLWPGRQLWNRDTDAIAPAEVLLSLASRTGRNIALLEKTTLRAFEGIVFEHVRVKVATRWVLPLGVYHRTRRLGGQQWCPVCLREDTHPYYRLDWRLAFSTSCSKHGVMLHDRCTCCGEPAVPHRGVDPECHQCGFDRRKSPVTFGDSRALQLEHTMRAVAYGTGTLPPPLRDLHPLAYFDLLRQVFSIVSSNPRSAQLRETVTRHSGGDPSPPTRSMKSAAFENLSTSDRHRMIAIGACLLEGWPFNFIGLCAEAGMWKSWAMRGDQRHIPFKYADPVATYLAPILP
jgi:hypothetical protein